MGFDRLAAGRSSNGDVMAKGSTPHDDSGTGTGMMGLIRRRLMLLLLTAAATSALTGSARAQFWESRQPDRHHAWPRDFNPFSIFGDHNRGWGSSNRFGSSTRPSQPLDYSRAPPPHKAKVPPTSTILVIGDSFADWLGYGLEQVFSDTPEIGIVRKTRATSGLVRYEGHDDKLQWPQVAKSILAIEKPSAIVVMLGLNDRRSLQDAPPADTTAAPVPPDAAAGHALGSAKPASKSQAVAAGRRATPPARYEFRTDKWAELYDKRIDALIAALRAKGVPVAWVGLPAIRGTRPTSDMNYLDELYRARAEKAGITYVDVWNGFVDENGRYTPLGPDFEGQIRRLRSPDGIHFTKAGATKLGHYVERELRRLMSSRVAPAKWPVPEASIHNGARPAVGPVIPLSAIGGDDRRDLVGAGNGVAPDKADPLVVSVFSRGDPLVAPAGRADNFSWPPRAGAAASAPAHTQIQPPASVASAPAAKSGPPSTSTAAAPAVAAAPPAAPPVPAEAVVSAPPASMLPPAKTMGGGRGGEKLRDVKGRATHRYPSARARRSRSIFDDTPRPPMPIGPAAVNAR